MLNRMNLQDLAVAEMWSVKVKLSSRITPRFLAVMRLRFWLIEESMGSK